MEKIFLVILFSVVAYLVSLCDIEIIKAIFWLLFTGVMMNYVYVSFLEVYPFLERTFNKINGVLS